MTKLEEEILEIIKEAGDIGVTARQIALRLNQKRENISHYLWILKKTGKITNKNRILWKMTAEKEEVEE